MSNTDKENYTLSYEDNYVSLKYSDETDGSINELIDTFVLMLKGIGFPDIVIRSGFLHGIDEVSNDTPQTISEGVCPNCGRMMEIRLLMTNPPQKQYICNQCGHTEVVK